MKQPFGSALPAAPTAGDVVFLDDSTIHFCYTDGVWTQISGASSGGEDTFSYGAFGVAIANETMVSGRTIFPQWVRYKASDIYNNTATYLRCTWDVLEVDDSGTIHNSWTEQTFASVAELYTFIATNFTPAGGGFISNHAAVRVYDIIDKDIPKIDKIWGLNTFYSILKGRNAYRSTYPTMPGTPGWSSFPAWFEDLCNQNMGFGAGHTYSANDERALWFSRNDQKRYGMPPPGYLCEITTNNNRWIWNQSITDFQALPSITTYRNTPTVGQDQRIYCSLYLSIMTAWDWFQAGGTTPLMQNLSSDGRSWIVLYSLEQSGNSDRRAIQVKPFGIDRVGLNWFDSSAYDLFALYTRKDFTPIQRQITSLGMSSAVKDLQWLEYNSWIPPEWGSTRSRYSLNSVGKQPLTTQFFLRDKTTDRVCPVSKARIVRAKRHRDAPYKYEVRR
jgi:hypothetical protein